MNRKCMRKKKGKVKKQKKQRQNWFYIQVCYYKYRLYVLISLFVCAECAKVCLKCKCVRESFRINRKERKREKSKKGEVEKKQERRDKGKAGTLSLGIFLSQ